MIRIIAYWTRCWRPLPMETAVYLRSLRILVSLTAQNRRRCLLQKEPTDSTQHRYIVAVLCEVRLFLLKNPADSTSTVSTACDALELASYSGASSCFQTKGFVKGLHRRGDQLVMLTAVLDHPVACLPLHTLCRVFAVEMLTVVLKDTPYLGLGLYLTPKVCKITAQSHYKLAQKPIILHIFWCPARS